MSSDLRVRITSDSTKLKSGLSEAKAAAKDFASDLKSEFAAAFAFGALIEGVRSAVEHFGNIGDLAERFNVSAVALQKLGFAGEQTGTSLESVARGLGKMRLAMSEAANKAGDARTVFNAVGVSTEQLRDGSLGSEEAFYRVADAVAHASTEAEQLQITTAVFGAKLAGELVPVLALGRKGLEDLGGQAAVVSDTMVAQLKRIDDSNKELKNNFTVLFGYLAIGFGYFVEFVRIAVSAIVNYYVVLQSATVNLGKAIGFALTGQFEKAGAALKQIITDAKEGLSNVKFAADQAHKRLDGKEAKSETEKKPPILQTDDEKKAEEDRLKVLREIEEQETKIEEAKLSGAQRIESMEARRVALLEQAFDLGMKTTAGLQKQLEAAKVLEQIDRERKTLNEKAQKDAEDLAKLKQQEAAGVEANAAKGETAAQKAERLQAKEKKLRTEAVEATDDKTAVEKNIEANKVKGELIDLALNKTKSFAAPTVDSLRAIGGGSGAVGPSADPALIEARRGNALLQEIRDAVKANKTGTETSPVGQ